MKYYGHFVLKMQFKYLRFTIRQILHAFGINLKLNDIS